MPIARRLHALAVAAFIAAALLATARSARADVEVQARVSRRLLAAGETTSLDVVVIGAVMGLHEPEFEIPFGLSVLGTSRSQSVSSVNGQVTIQVTFRYEIGTNRVGDYRLGPILVRVGSQSYESPPVEIRVTPSRVDIGGRASGPATLAVDVSPTDPWVGQPVMMRVRLIQRSTLAEDPSYTPPATPGFWSERATQPESYYADQGPNRVLVTETRTRLYPLAAGEAAIGEAAASLVLSSPSSSGDPLQWLGGRAPRNEVVIQSTPVRVRVRALPDHAPPSFTGAVGTFTPAWSADRERTRLDTPVTVRLEVRGVGNLPLMRSPEFRSSDVEPFASTTEDSLPLPSSAGAGLRRFQWTVLPRHQGRISIAAPEFAWFDPRDGQYHRLAAAPIALDVDPPHAAGAGGDEAFPSVFTTHPLDPGRHGAVPWAFALAGLTLGFAARLLWTASRPPPDQAARAQQREWMQAVTRSMGAEFWSAADRACEWLESHRQSVGALRRQIESSRYGGTRANAEVVQRDLVQRLERALPPPPPRWTLYGASAASIAAAATIVLLLGPRAGDPRGVARAQAADRAAREGEIDRARASWAALWREGARAPGLAARLAWSDLRGGAIAPASAWALRGDREEPRDAGLLWVIGKIRETGGLTGFSAAHFPVRSIEWSLLALLAGAALVLAWPRTWRVAAAAAVLLAGSLVFPIQSWMADRSARGVIREEVLLEGGQVALEPGQVVVVLEQVGARARVAAGRGISGWVPAASVSGLDPG